MYVLKLYIYIKYAYVCIFSYNESQNWYLNPKLILLNLKISISIPKYYIGFSKLILPIWKLLIESKNGHFNFENCYLNSKNLFDLWILNYYFESENYYFNSKNLLSLKINILILNIFIWTWNLIFELWSF